MTSVPATTTATARRPSIPGFAFPVIDLLTGMREARVVAVTDETPTIRSIRLDTPPGYRFRAGQHAFLRLETDVGPDARALSIAAAPSDGVLEFAARTGASAFKGAYFGTRPGDRVKVSRPLGRWTIDPSTPAVVFAGGTGITPVLSVLREGANRYQLPVRLVTSNHDATEIPYEATIQALPGVVPELSLAWHLSDLSAGQPEGEVYAGRIDRSAVEREIAAAQGGAAFYVTGPPAMVDAVERLLEQFGVEHARIRSYAQGRG